VPEARQAAMTPAKTVADKPFASGGAVEIQLDGGDYTIRAAADDRIRVAFAEDSGSAAADLVADGPRARIEVKNTPHKNFSATIELPKSANVTIHLSAGNLNFAGIEGDKDISSVAGNVEIAIGDPADYSTAEGSVKAGDIEADILGKSASGINPHFTWQGSGKHTLRATLGAGNLILKR
jgi:hypothetical protein